jgi:hypothetical protein
MSSSAASPAPAPAAEPPPPAEGDNRGTIVVGAGSFTTLLALAGVFALARSGTNIMGWYANMIIPAGAMLVGMVAASGYGIAAWLTGLKMTRKLMFSVMAELLISYFIAHYQEYWNLMDDSSIGGFLRWFDESTRAFAWEEHGKMGEPLGVLGYGLRALEIAGFVGGGALVPVILRAKPYCDPCRTYKRTKLLARLASGVKPGMFGKVDDAAMNQARGEGLKGVQAMFDAANKGDRALLQQEVSIRGIGRRAAQSLNSYVVVNVVRCPRCADGGLFADMMIGRGRQTKRSSLANVRLSGERIRMLFD